MAKAGRCSLQRTDGSGVTRLSEIKVLRLRTVICHTKCLNWTSAYLVILYSEKGEAQLTQEWD